LYEVESADRVAGIHQLRDGKSAQSGFVRNKDMGFDVLIANPFGKRYA